MHADGRRPRPPPLQAAAAGLGRGDPPGARLACGAPLLRRLPPRPAARWRAARPSCPRSTFSTGTLSNLLRGRSWRSAGLRARPSSTGALPAAAPPAGAPLLHRHPLLLPRGGLRPTRSGMLQSASVTWHLPRRPPIRRALRRAWGRDCPAAAPSRARTARFALPTRPAASASASAARRPAALLPRRPAATPPRRPHRALRGARGTGPHAARPRLS